MLTPNVSDTVVGFRPKHLPESELMLRFAVRHLPGIVNGENSYDLPQTDIITTLP